MRLIVLALLAGASAAAAADGSVDINLSNHTIEAQYATGAGSAEFNVGGLYNEDQKDWEFNLGLLAAGDTQVAGSRLDAGLGGRVYAVRVSDKDLVALGLGGRVRWFPGNGSFAIGGYAFYAPPVVTVMDGDHFLDSGVRAEVELQRNTALYVGYRWMHAYLTNQTSPYVDKGGLIGVRIGF
jgi:hypothetical protein